jgi:hypothetical protein
VALCAVIGLVRSTNATGAEPGALVTTTYPYSGQVEPFQVPTGVGFVNVQALGANGGYGGIYVEPAGGGVPTVVPAISDVAVGGGGPVTPEGSLAPGGKGGGAQAAVPVNPGETLDVNVGGAGEGISTPPARGSQAGVSPLTVPGSEGGYGGGGLGGGSEFSFRSGRTPVFFGGGGGGASTVSQAGTPLVVAGGGGGGAANGAGRTSSDAVQVQPDTYGSGSGSGNDPVVEIHNLNVGDVEIINIDWDTTHIGDIPSTPAGWTLVDLGSYGEVGEVANSFRPGITFAYSATYEKVATEPGNDYRFFNFPNREIDYQVIAFAVANADPAEPIAAHSLVSGPNQSDEQIFSPVTLARAHSAVLTITDFPQYLPPFNGFGNACAVEEYPMSPAPAALSSGTFAPLNSCDYHNKHDSSHPGAVSYANDVAAGEFPELKFTWSGYTNVVGGEELVLQPALGAGGHNGPVPSSGGDGGGSNAEAGAGEAGSSGTIDLAETEPGLGGGAGSASTPGSVLEVGGAGGSDNSSSDPNDEGGFTGGGGGGGYFGGVGGAFAECEFTPCEVRGGGGGGGGSDYAAAGSTNVTLTRAANTGTAEGNGEVTISYYTPYPTETAASGAPPGTETPSTVTLSAKVTAAGSCEGTIEFSIDGKDVGSPVAVHGNVAETNVRAPAAGTHHVSAVYTGALSTANQPGCLPSTSDPSTLTIPYPTQTQATPSPPTANVGETITLTATVTASITCSGTVQFEVDGKPVGDPVTLQEGSAQITITAPPAGAHPITATYSGAPSTATETGCLPSTSTPSTLTTKALAQTNAPAQTNGPAQPTATILAEAVVVKPGLCQSVRHFAIHLLTPRSDKLLSAKIYVDHRLVKTLSGGTRLYYLNLHGRPYSTVTVTLVAAEPGGKKVTGERVYHTCRPYKLLGHTKFTI